MRQANEKHIEARTPNLFMSKSDATIPTKNTPVSGILISGFRIIIAKYYQ